MIDDPRPLLPMSMSPFVLWNSPGIVEACDDDDDDHGSEDEDDDDITSKPCVYWHELLTLAQHLYSQSARDGELKSSRHFISIWVCDGADG